MMRRLFPIALASALLFSSAGCALLRKRKPKAQVAVAPQPIFTGVVSLVNEEARFVLIDNGMLPVPSTGAQLKSYSGGVESAELVATDVRKRPFTIADIRSGEPRKGDRVFVMPVNSAAAAPAVAPATTTPETAETSALSPLSEPPQLAPNSAGDQ